MSWNWLLIVVFAAVVGFLIGRGSPSRSSEAAHSEAEAMDGLDSSLAERSRTSRRMQQVVKRFSNKAKLNRALGEISITASSYDIDPDVYARLCAAVMSLSRHEFPAVMERISNVGTDEQSRLKFKKLLLQRWVEFDPDAATLWVGRQRKGENEAENLTLQFFVLQEAMLDHPAWAVKGLKAWEAEVKNFTQQGGEYVDPNDPFGEHFVRNDMNLFCLRVAMLPEPQREALRQTMGTELFAEGASGWTRGIASQASDDAVKALCSDYLSRGKLDNLTESLDLLAKRDWKLVKQWADSNESDEADRMVLDAWSKEDAAAAGEWFVNRSLDAKTRETRLSIISWNIGDDQERRKWIEAMEEKGDGMGMAWRAFVRQQTLRGELSQAADLLPKVGDADRKELRLEIYHETSHMGWLNGHGGVRVGIAIPNPKYAAFQISHPGYREFVLKQNAAALMKIRKYIETANASIGRNAAEGAD